MGKSGKRQTKIINHPDFGPVRADNVSKLQLIEKLMNRIPQSVWFDVFPKLNDSFWEEVDRSLQQTTESELQEILDQYGND